VLLKPGQSADDMKVALAGIVASQLATLAMPIQQPPQEVKSAESAKSAESLRSAI